MWLAIAPLIIFAQGDAPRWEQIDTADRVKVYRREAPGTSLLAFRGDGVVDASLATLMTVATTPERFAEWTDMLVDVAPLEQERFNLVVWEHYENPWPIADRDFVYRTTAEIDEKRQQVTLRYRSIERADAPDQKCCVRGEILDTFFRFTALGPKLTRIECEVLLDPKGWLPAWAVNLVQRDWPINTMTALRRQAAKPDIKPDRQFVGWTGTGASGG